MHHSIHHYDIVRETLAQIGVLLLIALVINQIRVYVKIWKLQNENMRNATLLLESYDRKGPRAKVEVEAPPSRPLSEAMKRSIARSNEERSHRFITCKAHQEQTVNRFKARMQEAIDQAYLGSLLRVTDGYHLGSREWSIEVRRQAGALRSGNDPEIFSIYVRHLNGNKLSLKMCVNMVPTFATDSVSEKTKLQLIALFQQYILNYNKPESIAA